MAKKTKTQKPMKEISANDAFNKKLGDLLSHDSLQTEFNIAVVFNSSTGINGAIINTGQIKSVLDGARFSGYTGHVLVQTYWLVYTTVYTGNEDECKHVHYGRQICKSAFVELDAFSHRFCTKAPEDDFAMMAYAEDMVTRSLKK